MSSEDLVSVVIVTWNSAATIGPLLDSIAAEITGPHEVIVVDNASSDATTSIVAGHVSDPTLVRNADNLGLAAANNIGMNIAKGTWYLIANPDTVLDPGCVEELLAAGDRHPRAAFLVAKLLHPDRTLQPGAGDLPTLREVLAGRKRALARQSQSGIWWDGWAHDEERQIGHGQEACYLVRALAVTEVGGQDPRYVLDWEGLDWSDRMRAAGWEIWFCPTATAIHIGGVSIRQVQLRWIRSSHRGMYLYFADRSPRAKRPLLAAVFALRAAAKSAALLAKGDVYARLRTSAPAKRP